MIPWRLYAGKIEIARAYQGRVRIFTTDLELTAETLVEVFRLAVLGAATGKVLLARYENGMLAKASTGTAPARDMTSGAKMPLEAYAMAISCALAEALSKAKSQVKQRANLQALAVAFLESARSILAENLPVLENAAVKDLLANAAIRMLPAAYAEAATAKNMLSGEIILFSAAGTAETATGRDGSAKSYAPLGALANSTTAIALDVNAETAAIATGAAKIVTWHEPELKHGVLIIRQSYGASLTDGKLEVE